MSMVSVSPLLHRVVTNLNSAIADLELVQRILVQKTLASPNLSEYDEWLIRKKANAKGWHVRKRDAKHKNPELTIELRRRVSFDKDETHFLPNFAAIVPFVESQPSPDSYLDRAPI